MKIKEISVEVKKSKSFQTFTSSELLTIENDDNIEIIKAEAFKRCRADVMEQIRIDALPPEPVEVQRTIKKG